MMPDEALADLVESGDLITLVPDRRVHVPLFWQTRSQSSRIMQGLSEIVLQVAAESLTSMELATEDS